MSTAPPVMPPKKKSSSKPPRDDKAVKIDRRLADKAAIIAKQLGYDSMAEYLSEMLRPAITRDWPKARKRLDDNGQSSPGDS